MVHAARCEIPHVAVALEGKVDLRRGPERQAQREEVGEQMQASIVPIGVEGSLDPHCRLVDGTPQAQRHRQQRLALGRLGEAIEDDSEERALQPELGAVLQQHPGERGESLEFCGRRAVWSLLRARFASKCAATAPKPGGSAAAAAASASPL